MKKIFLLVLAGFIFLFNTALQSQNTKDSLKATIAGISHGMISKDSLIKHPEIKCSIKDVKVVSFTMTYKHETDLIEKIANGNSLTPDMLDTISIMAKGTKIYFENIKAVGNSAAGSSTVLLPMIMVILK